MTSVAPSVAPSATSPADLPRRAPEGLYLHLPFCFHKCHYCDFFSVVEADGAQSPRQDAFTDALIRELEHQAQTHELRPRTLFVGGGTPTYLRADLWEKLLARMASLGILDQVEEFTVEANPETVTPELMQQLAAGGVNRASIGAQSFGKAALKALERWHDPDSVPRAMEACRGAGITNLNLDLIFAIPGQTLADLAHDLDRLVELAPTHLSTYGLTYEPNTALSARLKAGRVTPIPEDLEREMYALALDTLSAKGYEHYEVSNWAKKVDAAARRVAEPPVAQASLDELPNPHDALAPETTTAVSFPSSRTRRAAASTFRCAHNLVYWQNGEWLGCGPAAASHLDGARWKNAPNLPRYLEGCAMSPPAPPIEDFEKLPEERRIGEALMLGLRLSEGVTLDWLAGAVAGEAKAAKRRRQGIADMEQIGMLERTASHLRLTRKGLFVADAVIGKLI